MIKKLERLLMMHNPDTSFMFERSITIPAEEAAKIFAVLLATSNLLDSPLSNGKLISELDLADCLARGMERMTLGTEAVADVQKAFNNLGKE